MKALTLYIDKWYIIGAVCTDGVPSLIRPKTGEDCFWLYFYEDVANDTIVYGKDNKPHFHNNENHYYGDVFSLLTDSSSSYIRFGRKQEISKIFKASGIIDELKNSLGAVEGKIETFISFSKDISDAARLSFKRDVLIPENFEIKESVARIGHLALEHAFRFERYSEDGFYLLLNACNENLLYSVYERKDGLLLRKAENSLTGMGTDLRSRAILEKVVKSINQTTHFLQSDKELEDEYLRLSQFVDDWIIRLENARPGRPVTIPNVTFSKGNVYNATILKRDIDARTAAIVDDIIREIVTFVRNSGVTNDKIQGVLFLGNTFTNSQFLSAIKEQYTLSEDKYVHFKTSDLPNIVAVYTVMDCSQFKVATELGDKRGEAELEMQRLAEEEKKRQEKAEEIRQKKEEEYRKAHEADLRYEEAMRNVDDFERKQNYAQMEEWASIALTHRPNDLDASKKKNDAVRLLSEQKVREEQYRGIIARAQQSIADEQWQDALSQSDAALNLRPDSAEAKRIYNEAKRRIETAKEVDKYINRADLFLAQKSYDEALQELQKILSLDPENSDAINRVKEIETIQAEHSNKVSALLEDFNKSKHNSDFEKAIAISEKLAEIDTVNQRKWAAEIEKLKAAQEKAAEEKKRFEELMQKALDAEFKDDYQSFIHFASEALLIKSNDEISKRVDKAKQKLEQEKQKVKRQEKENAYQQDVVTVESLISEKKFDKAEDLLNKLQREFPEHSVEIKGLRKKLFAAQDFLTETPAPQKPRKPVGFTKPETKVQPVKPDDADDFFNDSPKKSPKKPSEPPKKDKPAPPKQAPKSNPKTGIDFFDMDFGPGKK